MATDKSVSVKVHGLRELQRAFKSVENDTPEALKAGFKEIAESVAADVRSNVPRRSGRAAGSVKARGSQRGGSIAAGGQAAPYYPWLDFGGSTGRGHQPGVAWSGAIKRAWLGVPTGEGRYLYPAIRENASDIEEKTDDLLKTVFTKNGFETRGGV